MKTTESKYHLMRADTRGKVDHGWLQSNHTFSFASYYNPERMNFGALRVLNDDIIAPASGFGTHPHENMEIISIPIWGSLEHKDSTGKKRVIKPGEVQIMSAGKGIFHSEYNPSQTEEANFLQIWIMPKELNINPRYDQKYFSEEAYYNAFKTVVSPTDPEALWINQNAFVSLAYIEKNTSLAYNKNIQNNGVYLFVMDGNVQAGPVELSERDALGIVDIPDIQIEATKPSKLLVLEVPMNY